MLKSFKILVNGQVQGVGFRPHVYNLAKRFDLTGAVSNNEEGVLIILTGSANAVQLFYEDLIAHPPPVSQIVNHSLEEIPFQNFDGFEILITSNTSALNLALTPDFAICDACKEEINDGDNRRTKYPFTTCVDCGPRWSVTKKFPFERENTSLSKFTMCPNCADEYTNPSDRRFHSQTNSCTSCGIQLTLVDSDNNTIEASDSEIFNKTANLIHDHNIVAIQNTSGFLLCCRADSPEIVDELRLRKNRPSKPFAVLFPSIDAIKADFSLKNEEIALLQSKQAPITIIPIKNYSGKLALKHIVPGLKQLGVMIPYTGILQLLANQLKTPIIATSGNIHGSPILSKPEEAKIQLKGVADYFLTHNLQINNPQDDSVVKYSSKFDQKVVFRRSRGYTPNYFTNQKRHDAVILAMGADLKSTIAFYPNDYLYISQYLGNLSNYDVYERYENTSSYFQSLFNQKADIVLTDAHPRYLSSAAGKEVAQSANANIESIQHHEAHFAAILGEHDLFGEKVLGVIFDGIGLGSDNAIWGGEFFEYETNRIERIHHLEYFNWILGDKMSNEPRISLLSLVPDTMSGIVENKFKRNEFNTYQGFKKDAKLKTSSIGRLFDAVGSLILDIDFNSYEGEAAILLENAIEDYHLDTCKSYLDHTSEPFSGKLIVERIIKDKIQGIDKQQIIANFLFTLAKEIISFAKSKNYEHIAFSGGVFQNTTLVDMIIALASDELILYFHRELAPNDENISFGQVMHYLKILK